MTRTVTARAGATFIAAAVIVGLATGVAFAAASVSIKDNFFDPKDKTVTPGTTVTWTHDGGNPHTVTADDGSFDSGTMSSGDTFSHAFPTAGTYPYHCEIHGAAGGSGMSGRIIVRAATTPTPTPTPTRTKSTATPSPSTSVRAGQSSTGGLSKTGAPLAPMTATGAALVLLGMLAGRASRRVAR